jgi:hypothetical protein
LLRSWTPRILLILALAIASSAFAQAPDAGAPPREAKKEHPRLIKTDGKHEDNEQLGGEPSLTETKEEPAAQVDGEGSPAEDCDLDCLEARLDQEEAEEQEKKSTLQVAEDTGSLGEEVQDDAGDALAAEPSTTPLDAAAVPEGRKLPTRLGPVRIKVGKTDDWVGIGFAAQLEFEYDQQLEGAGFVKRSNEFLEFRRIRFTLSSSFIDGRIKSRFQINLTPSAFDLIDMWFAFTRFKFAAFRVGQFKIPFDRYRATSYAALSFVDWPPTTRMFGSERQIGAEMFARSFRDLEYAFGVFNGTNVRAAHGVGITEVYGEKVRNRSNIGFGEAVSEFHPELTGRFAKNFGKINTDANSDLLGTKELRHSLGAGFSWDARPNAIEDLDLRFSLEWLGKISGFDMNIISYVAWFKPWEGGKILFGPVGVMGELGYRFSLMWELALRYSIVYLTPWLRSDARSYGEFQIANAMDPAAAMAQYGRNGDTTTNAELVVAGSAHIIGNSLKVVTQAAWLTQLWNTGMRNGIRLNVQLQLLF